MRTPHYAAITAAVAGMILSGCATGPRTTDATYPVNRDLAERRVYTQEQHQKTGRTESAGEGLETLDPAVRIDRGR
ncbi:MAG: hypothetical protein ABR589_11765 [Chthoniobacterales bacterium]